MFYLISDKLNKFYVFLVRIHKKKVGVFLKKHRDDKKPVFVILGIFKTAFLFLCFFLDKAKFEIKLYFISNLGKKMLNLS